MDWRSLPFLERRIHLRENDLWTDCNFTIGPEHTHYSGHKLLLAMASPVFEEYFFKTNLGIYDPLHLPDVDPAAFKKLLQYIYYDNVVLENYIEAREVHRISMKFAMPELENKSLRRIKETVTFKTACNLLAYSRFVENKYGSQHGKPLTDSALEIIIRDTSRVLQARSFTEITIATLEQILRIDELNVDSEIELINALLKWARANCNAQPLTSEWLHALAAPAMRHLRLLTLTPQQVVEAVAPTPLMSDAECLAVLKLVAVPPPGPVPEPAAFSACRRRRGANVPTGHANCSPLSSVCHSCGAARTS